MCRVFGFRSAFPSAVHNSLVRARNALTVQSRQHPDGWGVAFFEEDGPHLLRGTGPAFVDGDFTRAAGVVSARTVLAHVRKASAGGVQETNCHPFVRGPWAFAHNGDIARWGDDPSVQAEVEALIDPTHRHFEGETDSERCFALFLTHLQRRLGGGDPDHAPFEQVREALLETTACLRALADPGAPKPSVLTIVLARSDLLVAIHSGNTLWYSTHKGVCPERSGCTMLDASCEAPARPGQSIRHLLIASEPLSTQNVWLPVPDGGVVGVDARMTLHGPTPSRAARTQATLGVGI